MVTITGEQIANSQLSVLESAEMPLYESTFWAAVNIIFDLDTGKTSNVMMLVNHVEDATVFNNLQEANTYLSFVQRRATKIQWHLDSPTPQRPGFRIRGVQLLER